MTRAKLRAALVLAATSLVAALCPLGAQEGGGAGKPSPFDMPFEATAPMVGAKLGAPDHVRDERTFRVWDYNLGPADENDMGFAWSFYFEQPSGRLLSITHNAADGVALKELFPARSSKKVLSPGPNSLPVLYRELDGDRVAIAVGVSSAAELCSQVIIMRRSVVGRFYPWLEQQTN